jgi:3-hydroxyisobutyrate dehydrogenase
MAGSIPQARAGSLFLIVGGERDVFEQISPLLEDLSSSIAYMGPAGQAARMKALVNMVMNINTAGLAEGLGLADAMGLDLTVVREVFSKTGAQSRVLETDGADMQNRDHDVYFSAAHAAKDAHIATELAHELSLTLPLAEATALQYDRMVQMGLGELDKSGISELTFPKRAHGRK